MLSKTFPVAFFVLTFLLSIPFYVLSGLAYLNILFPPEVGGLCVALFALTPIASASILTYRKSGWNGVKKLLTRIFDSKRIEKKQWYAPILLLMPLIFLLSLAIMVVSGATIPAALAPTVALPAVFLFFLVLAAGEEVGWMGLAFPPMQEKLGALKASLVLGLIWAVWHLPFLVVMMSDSVTILSQFFTLLGTRILIAWIFNNTGQSVFATVVFHAADNAALVTLPEISAISPAATVVHCILILLAAVIVTVLWGPQTLAGFRLGD